MKIQTVILTLLITAILAISSTGLFGQTRIDVGNQTRNADFGQAESTVPAKTGLTLPAACRVGEQFFKTDAVAGKNLFGCVATNQWSLLTGADPLPSATGQANKVLSNDGSQLSWRALAGDVSGPPGALVVEKLWGRSLPSIAPAHGDSLVWDSGQAAWIYGAMTVVPGDGIEISGNVISVDDSSVVRYYTFNGPPAGACQAGRDFYTDLSSSKLYFCPATDTWQLIGGSGAHTHPVQDITGLAPSATIDTTNAGNIASGQLALGRLASSGAAAGQILKWDGSAWTPGADISGPAYTFNAPLAEAAGAVSLATGQGISVAANQLVIDNSVVPRYTQTAGAPSGPCFPGSQFHVDTASSALWSCTATDTWTRLAPNIHQHAADQINSGTLAAGRLPALAGDVSSAAGTNTVTVAGLQGRTVTSTAPSSGQILKWDGSSWTPGADISGPAYTFNAPLAEAAGAVSLATGQGISVASNQLVIDNSVVPRYTQTAGAPSGPCFPGSRFHVDTASSALWSCTATDTWTRLAPNIHQHSADQITSGILAAGRLPGLAGDVSSAAGTNTVTVAGLQGRTVAGTAPSSGQVLQWSVSNNRWEPATVSGGGAHLFLSNLGATSALAAGSTIFTAPYMGTHSATFGYRNWTIPRAGSLRSLRVNHTDPPANCTFTATVVINASGGDTVLTKSSTSGSTSTANLVDSVNVNAWDLVSLKLALNGTGCSGSVTITQWAFELAW